MRLQTILEMSRSLRHPLFTYLLELQLHINILDVNSVFTLCWKFFHSTVWHLRPKTPRATGRKRRQDGWSGKGRRWCWKALSCMEAKKRQQLCLIPSKQSRQGKENSKYIYINICLYSQKKREQAMQNIKNSWRETNKEKSNKSSSELK